MHHFLFLLFIIGLTYGISSGLTSVRSIPPPPRLLAPFLFSFASFSLFPSFWPPSFPVYILTSYQFPESPLAVLFSLFYIFFFVCLFDLLFLLLYLLLLLLPFPTPSDVMPGSLRSLVSLLLFFFSSPSFIPPPLPPPTYAQTYKLTLS